MRPFLLKPLIAMSAIPATPAISAAPVEVIPIFRCVVGAKVARVDAEDGRLVYRFGRPDRPPELTIAERPGLRPNLFWRRSRMAAPVRWLRFTRGEWSYILSHHEADARKGVTGASALTIMRGRAVVRDLACRGLPDFPTDFDPDDILVAEDDDAHSPF